MATDRKLIDYLPHFMKGYTEMNAIMETEQVETDRLWKAVNDALSDQFILEATENGVKRWESMLGISPKDTDSLDERKFRILTKVNQELPYTIRKLERALTNLCGNDMFSIEVSAAEYSVELKLGLGNKNNYQEVLDVLRKMIPANMTQLVQILYNPNSVLSQFTHDNMEFGVSNVILYGKTTQDGTPTPDAPVDLVSAGASGSINVRITNGTDENTQTFTAQTPNGLPGIPVTSGGNYTDENGQQWICDEIDFARGVYVQRVRTLDFSTFTWKRTAYSNDVQKGYYATVIGFYNSRHNFFHTHYRWLGREINSGSGANSLGASQSVFDTRTIGEIGFLSKAEGRDTFGVVVGINDGTPVGILQLVCVEPIETRMSAEELSTFKVIQGNKSDITVFNDGDAGMEVQYGTIAGLSTYTHEQLRSEVLANAQ